MASSAWARGLELQVFLEIGLRGRVVVGLGREAPEDAVRLGRLRRGWLGGLRQLIRIKKPIRGRARIPSVTASSLSETNSSEKI